MKKALIIIPERDKQDKIDKICKLLKKQNIEYNILVIHQNNKYLFNKGMLCNIGVYLAKKHGIEYDYIILHDVDIYPILKVDYSYTNTGVLFNTKYHKMESVYETTSFDRVCIINKELYYKMNGFSNKFFGANGEAADNFYLKCIMKGVNFDIRKGEFEIDIDMSNEITSNLPDVDSLEEDGINVLREVDECKNMNDFTCKIVEKIDDIMHYYVDFKYSKNTIEFNCEKYLSKKELKLGVINGGNYFEKFIKIYFSRKYNTIINSSTNLKECDVIVSSYFGNESIDNFKYSMYKIFVSAEHISIEKLNKNYDLILGNINVDENHHGINYIYYPYYAMSIFEQLKYKGLEILDKKKTKFCAFMYRMCFPHREQFYNELSKYKEVSALGKCCSNKTCNADKNYDRMVYTDNMTYQDLAIEKYSDYKFVLSMENENVKGYITEKFIIPVKAGCIPVYWGTEDILDHFSEDSFIYINKFASIAECIEHIKKVDNNDELYYKYLDNMKKSLNENKYIKSLFI